MSAGEIGTGGRGWRALAWGALSLAATMVLFQGTRIYLNNHSSFSISFADALGWLAVATALLAGALALAGVALAPRWRAIHAALLFGAAYFAWFKANFLDWDYGAFDGAIVAWEQYTARAYADIGALFACFALALLFRRQLLPHCRSLAGFLVLTQLLSIVLLTPLAFARQRAEILAKTTVALESRNSERISRQSNIIIVIVDTLQSDVVAELLAESPQRRRLLEGFTFFRDAVSRSTLTWLSVPDALTGSLYLNQMPYSQYLNSVYESPASALKNLHDAGYYIELVPWGSSTPIPNDSSFISNTTRSSFEPRLSALTTIAATGLFHVMPQFVQRRIHAAVLDVALDSFQPGMASNLRFIAWTDGLPVEFIDPPLVKLIHLRGPHIPLLAYGAYGLEYTRFVRSRESLRSRQVPFSRANYKAVAATLLDAVLRLLAKIKAADAYDRSTIMIFGDHGAGPQGLYFSKPSDWPLEAGRELVSSSMQVGALAALLAKQEGAHGPLANSNKPVALSDIACTLNRMAGRTPERDCGSLFAQDTSARRRRFVDLRFHIIDAKGFLPRMREWEIGSRAWQAESWRRSGRVFAEGRQSNGPGPAYMLGDVIRFGDGANVESYLEHGWRYPRRMDGSRQSVRWTDGKSAAITIPLNARPASDLVVEVTMQAYTQREKLRQQRVRLSANGMLLGELRVVQKHTHRLRIARSALTGQSVSLRFDLPDAATGLFDRGLSGAEVFSLRLIAAR